ncbi:hypothetical protein QNM99_09965 [Pseudomonas sp. PCH446]
MCALLWWQPRLLGIQPSSDEQVTGLLIVAGTVCSLLLLAGSYFFLWGRSGKSAYQQKSSDDVVTPMASGTVGLPNNIPSLMETLKIHLHEQYGPLWRYKVRLLLVVGEPEQIAAMTPGLAKQQWLEGQRTVLLWGGSVRDEREGACLPSGAA